MNKMRIKWEERNKGENVMFSVNIHVLWKRPTTKK